MRTIVLLIFLVWKDQIQLINSHRVQRAIAVGIHFISKNGRPELGLTKKLSYINRVQENLPPPYLEHTNLAAKPHDDCNP